MRRTTQNEVRIYTVECDVFTHGDSLYGDESGDYPDNALRFSVLGHAAATLRRFLEPQVTIVHGHDWHAGPGIGLCSTAEHAHRVPSVLTIHNASYEGLFSKHDIHYTGLSPDTFIAKDESVRAADSISFLFAAANTADAITTVSPGYANQILTGAATDGVFASVRLRNLLRSRNLTGILNGVDYTEWDPANDASIPQPYSWKNTSGKHAAKIRLLDEFAIVMQRSDLPLIGMVARLSEQKGFEELCFGGVLDHIAELPINIVILGTGEQRYEDALDKISLRHPNLSVRCQFNERVAHLIEAGSDLFFMPSRYEPCGLNQLYSLRYGTPPIVHATGGLADTVLDIDTDPSNGTGFTYEHQTFGDIVNAVRRAISCFVDRPEEFREMAIRGMKSDFSWDRTAGRYEDLYERLLHNA